MLKRILAFLIVMIAIPALADSPANGRYQLLAVSGGFVRLDTVTGAMTYCRDEVDKFGCTEMAPDQNLPGEKTGAENSSENKIAGETEDFEKALSMAEKALRSFMSIAKEQKSGDCTL